MERRVFQAGAAIRRRIFRPIGSLGALAVVVVAGLLVAAVAAPERGATALPDFLRETASARATLLSG